MENTTRRFLLMGAAASATALTTTNALAALKNGWEIVNGNKFANSPEEGMRLLPVALKRMKFPVAYETVKAVIDAKPNGMRQGTLQNGQPNLIAMVSGKGEVDFDVKINFRPTTSGLQTPVINTLEWDIGGFTLILPETCFNWCYRKMAPPLAQLPPATPVGSCNCCTLVTYILPAGMKHVSYAVFGPYPLDLAKCGHPGQWDHGCVEHSCFRDAESKVIAWEREKKGVIINDQWRQDGAYQLATPTLTETKHGIWLPHEVVNGFGLVLCADSGFDPLLGKPAEAMKFSYMAWKDPYTRERMWHMDPLQVFEG